MKFLILLHCSCEWCYSFAFFSSCFFYITYYMQRLKWKIKIDWKTKAFSDFIFFLVCEHIELGNRPLLVYTVIFHYILSLLSKYKSNQLGVCMDLHWHETQALHRADEHSKELVAVIITKKSQWECLHSYKPKGQL